MKQAKKNMYKLSVILLLTFGGQYSIATEETTSDNHNSVNESSDQIGFSQTCSPMPQCARDNDHYQPDDELDWVAKIMEMLQENEDDLEDDNS